MVRGVDLGPGMVQGHEPGKLASAVQVLGVICGLVQLQKGVRIAGYPVAEAGPLPKETSLPDCIPAALCRIQKVLIPKNLYEEPKSRFLHHRNRIGSSRNLVHVMAGDFKANTEMQGNASNRELIPFQKALSGARATEARGKEQPN